MLKDLAIEIAELVEEKGKAYGDAINFVEVALKELYPNGVPVASYSDMLLMVRVLDKLKRLSTDPNAFGENPWQDVAGYGLRGVEKSKKQQFYYAPVPNSPQEWAKQGVTFGIPSGPEITKAWEDLQKGGINSVVRGNVKIQKQYEDDHKAHVKAHEVFKNAFKDSPWMETARAISDWENKAANSLDLKFKGFETSKAPGKEYAYPVVMSAPEGYEYVDTEHAWIEAVEEADHQAAYFETNGITDEDVEFALDVLFDIINEGFGVEFDLYDIAWISLKDQGFTDSDIILSKVTKVLI